MKAWEVPQYDCPHCGAFDSTHCAVLRVEPPTNSPERYDEARAVGCRVAYYHDLAVEDREEKSWTS